jgi:hypothetical protein
MHGEYVPAAMLRVPYRAGQRLRGRKHAAADIASSGGGQRCIIFVAPPATRGKQICYSRKPSMGTGFSQRY